MFKDGIIMNPLQIIYINLGFIIYNERRLSNKSIKFIIHNKVQEWVCGKMSLFVVFYLIKNFITVKSSSVSDNISRYILRLWYRINMITKCVFLSILVVNNFKHLLSFLQYHSITRLKISSNLNRTVHSVQRYDIYFFFF